MNRRSLFGSFAALTLLQSLPVQAATPMVHVYKNPTCGCCTGWVEHLKSAGFSVEVTETDETSAVRQRLGVPDRLGSCHTGIAGGYAIEGHVPAADIKRLLAMRPEAVGLAVPGMPVGSPGMEYGDRKDSYKVLLIDRKGRETVFASYPAQRAPSKS
ncbi:DUF411 domain-containing protein [Variovorax sp. YR216]|uniref:DUF411 domain-containing protein n=1 Tax=Variovorax sp. YR216 TaxID=1882828 RepID=UPI000B820BBA